MTFRPAPLWPAALEGVVADFFLGPSTLGAPAVTRIFAGDSGAVTFDVPAGSKALSARIHALDRDSAALSVEEAREYGLAVPADDASTEGYAVIRDMRTLAVRLALDGGQEDAARSLITSNARDCRGRDVSGAQFELVDGETNLPVPTGAGPGAPIAAYWRFALPSTTCTFTSSDTAAG